MEGAHLGVAWMLAPEDSGWVELRLFEGVFEDVHVVGVLLSVTERQLVKPHDWSSTVVGWSISLLQ